MDHDVTTARASLQPMKGARATVSHAAIRQMEFGILDNACTMPLCLAHYLLHLLPCAMQSEVQGWFQLLEQQEAIVLNTLVLQTFKHLLLHGNTTILQTPRYITHP